MAKNDDTRRHDTHSQTARSHHGGTSRSGGATGADRERRRDRVVNTVKERPYTAAALATVAAGAAAFFLTRSKSDKPLMNWGQETTGKQQDLAASDRSLETASTAPSGSAGTSSGSPSAVRAASLAATGSSTNAAATPGTDAATASTTGSAQANAATPDAAAKSVGAGLDQTAKTDTKVGAISYGA
ncbi:hypothetical protein GGQ97_002183 [Sphingomonas kaistensis]|uniref:Uncharacterized protein n=1 Tax=Sphingomonas kaistensis TaxID=298708 RepID=A0A7X5Y7Q9_9SPHN|nr:hypothetical protein [Sphingomonas kaistensis]NJC06390.1 hypothetical protein [Sphingomonas kaistensis]